MKDGINEILIKNNSMQFGKKNNTYMISRITGSQDNILGVSFSDNNSTNIKIIEWNLEETKPKQTSDDQVLKQVLSGLEEVNQFLGTNYKFSKIYFVPTESASSLISKRLTIELIRHYHSGKIFKEA